MTDKELIELAAKAAGIEWRKDWLAYLNEEGLKWNPLGDDGDALRLAVRLEMLVDVDADGAYAIHPLIADIEEPLNDDPYAATRRAIVRAAAEIGRML